MRAVTMLAAAAALVTLTGCERLGIGGGGGGGSNSTANAASGNTSGTGIGGGSGNQSAGAGDQGGKPGGDMAEGAQQASSGPQPAANVTLDRTYMMGRWTDTNDCDNAIEFSQDGQFIASNGGRGLWHLQGDRLTMTGNSTATLQVVPVDQNTITVVNADGSLGRSTRC